MWTQHLLKLNIDSAGSIICAISTILFIYFGLSLVFDIFWIAGIEVFDDDDIDSYSTVIWIIDVLVAFEGIYTAIRGWVANNTKTVANAAHFKGCLMTLAFLYLISTVVYYILEYDELYDFIDDHYDLSWSIFIVGLVVSLLVCGFCCGFCYS